EQETVTPKKATGEWVPAFLATLRETANVRRSCEQAGISRTEAYRHRDRDEAFKAQWDEAIEDAVDKLEDVARQRAMETSDTLLIFLQKSHRRRVSREAGRFESEAAQRLEQLEQLAAKRAAGKPPAPTAGEGQQP